MTLLVLLMLLTLPNIELLVFAGVDCGESAIDGVEVKALLPETTVEKALGATFPYEDADEARGEESDSALENLRTNPSWTQHRDAAFDDMMSFFFV